MRLGCIRQRHVSQQWMSLSIGGIEFIDGLDWVRSDNLNLSKASILTSGSVTLRQSFQFSSKDSSKSIGTTIITSKKKDVPSDDSLSSSTDQDRQSDISPSGKEVIRLANSKSEPPKNKETKLLEMKRPYEARRLIVKRSAMADLDTTAIIKSPIDLRQRIGIVNRRFPLEHEITDSGGKTIWIPVKTIVNDRGADTKLPQINASAWLDPSTYCRGGGKTIAGTVAARQLLHGKKDLMEVLGHAVYSSTSKLVQRHRSIVLCGHGVPPQLLQHHIDSADKLLLHLNASEVSFKQFNVSQSDNVAAMTDAVRDIRWGHVRDVETGENRVITWPLDDITDWEYDLQLYWTVMNRIATRLGLPVLLKQPQAILPMPETLTRRPRADYNAPLLLNNSMLNVPPHHWRVKFCKDLYFSSDQFPTDRSHLYPVIEWTPLEGVATPGHVCIRLQGQSTMGKADTPVSLCFDASFRSNSASSIDSN